MKIYTTPAEIKAVMEEAEIEITDHQLLGVMWNICYQLADLNQHFREVDSAVFGDKRGKR